MTIKLTKASIGTRYRTRGGKIVKIILKDNHPVFPYESENQAYTSSGRVWDDKESSDDLVALADDETKLQLKVGATYLTRDNERVTIVSENPDECISYPFTGDNDYTYDVNGFYYGEDEIDDNDLVSLADPIDEVSVKPQLGGVYLTRDGETVQIIRVDTYPTKYPYLGDNDVWYTANGKDYDNRDLPVDLISTVPLPSGEFEPKLSLVVGQRYRTREGNVIKILSYDGRCTYPYTGSNDVTYTSDGSAWVREDRRDIVAHILDHESVRDYTSNETPSVRTDTKLWDEIYSETLETLMYQSNVGISNVTEEFADKLARAAKIIADRAIVQKDN
jgi:hypothetical protein